MLRNIAPLALLALTVSVATLPACGSSAAEAPIERPPSPRLDEGAPGGDPIDEPPRERRRRRVPLPPVAQTPDAPRAARLPSPASRDATLYVIAGRPLTAADLGDFILRYFPDRAREPLGQLVDEVLVQHEAARENVTVDEPRVSERTAVYLEERRREVRVQYGEDATLEDLLARSFGRTLEEFGHDAERLARVGLLRDRLVRLEQRREERVEVRALTFEDEEQARAAARNLREGADMTLLARRLGLRAPSAPPPLGRSDVQPAERAAEVFAAAPGTVLEPRAFTGRDGRVWWEVIKIVGAWPADDRPWRELAAVIEKGLAARPVGVPEYLAWRRRVVRRAGVDVQRDGRGLVPWLGEDGQR